LCRAATTSLSCVSIVPWRCYDSINLPPVITTSFDIATIPPAILEDNIGGIKPNSPSLQSNAHEDLLMDPLFRYLSFFPVFHGRDFPWTGPARLLGAASSISSPPPLSHCLAISLRSSRTLPACSSSLILSPFPLTNSRSVVASPSS